MASPTPARSRSSRKRSLALIATATAHATEARRVGPLSPQPSLDFVLPLARSANVRGQVVDASGGPIERALVLAQQEGRAGLAASAWSDKEGRFALDVAPGQVTLDAQAEAYAPSRLEIEAPVAQVTLALAPTSTLSGTVVDDATERTVSGVLVTAYSRSVIHPAAPQVTTDAEGQFRLTGLHAGAYALRAGGPEWGGGEATASVGVAEAAAPIVLRVRAATSVTGVIRASGESCGGGGVWPAQGLITATGPNGSCVFNANPGVPTFSPSGKCNSGTLHRMGVVFL